MKNSKHLFLTSLLAVATASVFAQSEDVPTAYGWIFPFLIYSRPASGRLIFCP